MRPAERIPEEPPEETKRRWAEHHRRKRGQYIAAMPMGWIGVTFNLSPHATRAALAIWFQAKRSRSNVAAVSAQLLDQFGVKRKTGYLALGELEAAGLIQVDRRRGRAPRVTILERTAK